jgi:hypothetical protein
MKVKDTGKIKKVPSPKINQPINMKTSGIKIRGTGAATKGLMARGPMA